MPHPPLPRQSPPRFRRRPSRSRYPLPPSQPQPLEKRRMKGTRSWRSYRLDKHRHTYTHKPSEGVTLHDDCDRHVSPCGRCPPPPDLTQRALSAGQRRKIIKPSSRSFSTFRPSPSLRCSGVPEVRPKGRGGRKFSRTHQSR